MVHLRDESHLAVVESFDEREVPQRSRTVEGDAGDVGDDLGDLSHRAGRACRDTVDVRLEVEVGILDPHGMAQIERDRHESATERFEQVHPVGQHLEQALVREALAGTRVEDERSHDVGQLRWRLHVEERRVHPAQRFHGLDSLLVVRD